MPDPSIRHQASEDRPIGGTGKYNLNFIDWQNEFDNIMDYDENDEENDSQEGPIAGMDRDTFEAIVVSIFDFNLTTYFVFFSKRSSRRKLRSYLDYRKSFTKPLR